MGIHFKMGFSLCTVAMMFVGCQPTQQLADPSAAQEQAAFTAYEHLKEGQFDDFLSQLEPTLQAHFQDNQKVMKKFAASIPKQQYSSKKILIKQMAEEQGKSHYKVSYELKYPQNLVQYDVSFDAPNGSEKIRNFNIQVFGESTK
jgi:hypothetical protein